MIDVQPFFLLYNYLCNKANNLSQTNNQQWSTCWVLEVLLSLYEPLTQPGLTLRNLQFCRTFPVLSEGVCVVIHVRKRTPYSVKFSSRIIYGE